VNIVTGDESEARTEPAERLLDLAPFRRWQCLPLRVIRDAGGTESSTRVHPAVPCQLRVARFRVGTGTSPTRALFVNLSDWRPPRRGAGRPPGL